MKVVFISNSIYDGAGIAAYRIFNSVLKKGVEGVFYSNDASKLPHVKKLEVPENKTIFNFFYKKYYWRKYRGPSLEVLKEYDYFTVPVLEHNTPFSILGFKPDIIHLHWINNILDFPSFFRSLPAGIPIVITLHDMSLFTGGCIYSWDCEKFIQTCHDCPQLPGRKIHDLSYRSQKLKLSLFQNKNIYLTADSYWIEKEARKSRIFHNIQSLSTIHYPIDTDAFMPIEKQFAKQSQGLAPDEFVLCFGATYVNSRRKGMLCLLKALELIYKKHKKIRCIVYGSNFEIPVGFDLPPVTSLGKISTEQKFSMVYSSADLFVIPSLQEAFGQTCLEAMCCGTPVVGFDVGGIPDMIKPDFTGLLAEPENVNSLADKILYMIEHPEERKKMGRNAREYAVANFSMEVQGKKHVELYEQILSEKTK